MWTIDVDSMTETVLMWKPEWSLGDFENYQLILSNSRNHEDYKTVMLF
jgi:hypothetical protein